MAGWHLDTKMAQDIVARTMRIIDTNINVMDARGRIIGSGDRERIGELHEGALLVLSQGRVVDIDDAVAKHLHGVRQGINLPLRLEGEIVGVIGLTGEPESLRKYGELVCMTAEMMLEQSRLMHLLAQDSRLREELVMNLIQAEENTPALTEWAQRLGIDLNQPRVAAVVEVDSDDGGAADGYLARNFPDQFMYVSRLARIGVSRITLYQMRDRAGFYQHRQPSID